MNVPPPVNEVPTAAPPNLTVDTSDVVQPPVPQVEATTAHDNDADDISKGLASLVNLSDLNSPAGNNSYNPFDLSSNASITSSKVGSTKGGTAPSLKEISKTAGKTSQSKGPVMKAPPTSAMVPHPQQQQGYAGYSYGQQAGYGVGGQQQPPPMVSPTYAQYGQQQPPMASPTYGQQQPPMASPTYGQYQGQGFGQQQSSSNAYPQY